MDVSYCTPWTDLRYAESHVCDVPHAAARVLRMGDHRVGIGPVGARDPAHDSTGAEHAVGWRGVGNVYRDRNRPLDAVNTLAVVLR